MLVCDHFFLLVCSSGIFDRCFDKSVDFHWGGGFYLLARLVLCENEFSESFLDYFMIREKKDSDWSCQSLGFILIWIKLANAGILEQGENFAVMWVMSYGRVLCPSWWKGSFSLSQTHRAGSLQCQHSNHACRQKLVMTRPYLFVEFHIWCLVPETDWNLPVSQNHWS